VNARTAAIVKRIFELANRGFGYKGIVVSLNQDGYRNDQGQRFRVYHIPKICVTKLISETWNTTGVKIAVLGALCRSRSLPPIIEKSLFDRVQAKLEEARYSWQNSYAYRANYLLSRLVVCGA
jgi:site-specific DNA recombinase